MNDAKRAADFLRRKLDIAEPELAVVLGSGLGSIAETLLDSRGVSAGSIPGFPPSSVAGHEGEVRCGRWGGCSTLIFRGRVHLYEGHPVGTVTLAVRTAAELGARELVLTNAAGSCDGSIPPGCLMRATDLLDLFFRRLRTRVPTPRIGMAPVLDPSMGKRLDTAAIVEGIHLRTGVLCGSLGPSYETASEVRLWRRIGGHAACMSTVPEAFAARAAGMRVGVVSMISNYGTGISPGPLDHRDVMDQAARAGVDLGRLLRRFATSVGA